MRVRKLVAGVLLTAAVAAPTLMSTAALADSSARTSVAGDVGVMDFLVQGPFPTYGECAYWAQWWDTMDGRSHYCRYEDGSGGYARGWWVWARS